RRAELAHRCRKPRHLRVRQLTNSIPAAVRRCGGSTPPRTFEPPARRAPAVRRKVATPAGRGLPVWPLTDDIDAATQRVTTFNHFLGVARETRLGQPMMR